MLHLYNTLTREKEEFKTLNPPHVGLYTCGPTVYHYVHIGNHRTNILNDIVKRVLLYNNFEVNHVMNITDVGHLTDDADNGEDKMEKGAVREGKSAWDIAEFYTDIFKQDLKHLNIIEPNIWCKATDHIPEQIAQVQTLIDKGYTYETSDGIYMDTTKVPNYGQLAQLEKQQLEAGARIDMGDKKNSHDFALWKFSKADEQRQMEWDAFGRKGFPGWHIECSAMACKYLGEQFDIHMGGIDLSRVHHVNEIAQAECVTDKHPWVHYWIHGEFLLVQDKKMSKSLGNLLTIDTLIEKKYNPLAYRYFILQAHYRKQLNFTWNALDSAQHGLLHLQKNVLTLKQEKINKDTTTLKQEFLEKINNDLDTAGALALIWDALKQKTIDYDTLVDFDRVLGLGLAELEEENIEIPSNIQDLLDTRAHARAEKNWQQSDKLRDEIATYGFLVEDTEDGQKLSKK